MVNEISKSVFFYIRIFFLFTFHVLPKLETKNRAEHVAHELSRCFLFVFPVAPFVEKCSWTLKSSILENGRKREREQNREKKTSWFSHFLQFVGALKLSCYLVFNEFYAYGQRCYQHFFAAAICVSFEEEPVSEIFVLSMIFVESNIIHYCIPFLTACTHQSGSTIFSTNPFHSRSLAFFSPP